MLENRTVLHKGNQIEAAVQMRSKSRGTIVTVMSIIIIIQGTFVTFYEFPIGLLFMFVGVLLLMLSSKKHYDRTVTKQYNLAIPPNAVLSSHTKFTSDQVIIHDLFENEEITSAFTVNRYVSFRESNDFLYLKDKMNTTRIMRKDSFIQGDLTTFKEYMRNHGILQTK